MKLDRFINRPVLSTVISVLIVILGIIGLATLPVTQYPDIAPPTVQVRATYTGANSTAVLNSVIAPLEDQINGVENMMYIQSSASNNGAADINVYFNQGTDPDMAAVNVQNRVSMAQGLLPAEVTKVGVTTQKRQNSMLMVFSLYDETDSYNIEFIENYANINLIPEIKRVKGVGDANVLETRLVNVIGETGNNVMMRLMGLILMVIAVECFVGGMKPILIDIIQNSHL